MKKSVIVLLMCIAIQFLSGCALCPQPVEETIIPTTSQEALMIAVQKTNWLVTISILGIAASAVALFNGSKNAIPIAVGCFVALTLSLMVARFAYVLALGGTVVSVALSVYGIYVKSKAIKEIVAGVQKYKNERMTDGPTLRERLAKQSPSTKTIVKEVKAKL